MCLILSQVTEGEEAPQASTPAPVVEEEEPEKEVWNAYTTVKGLTISISGLKEGKRYKFRVAAKNIMGMSLFTETRQPVEIKEQMRKSRLLIWVHYLEGVLVMSCGRKEISSQASQ